MDDERSEQVSTPCQVEGTACGSGCNCGSAGAGKRGKLVICLIVLAAALLVLARGFTQKAANKTAQAKPTFATTLPESTPKTSPTITKQVTPANPAQPVLWGKPLKDLASLNQVAAQHEAVFVYVPIKGKDLDKTAKQQIERATAKAQAGGTKIACFMLDTNSQDYARVTSQAPAPCVLAMVKGGGSGVVSQITETNLLQTLVTASRPSSCAPSGCAPSTPGCN